MGKFSYQQSTPAIIAFDLRPEQLISRQKRSNEELKLMLKTETGCARPAMRRLKHLSRVGYVVGVNVHAGIGIRLCQRLGFCEAM